MEAKPQQHKCAKKGRKKEVNILLPSSDMRLTKKKKFELLIEKYAREKSYVKIDREYNNQSADVDGFILSFSRDFMLVQKEEEFYLNGYAIIKMDLFEGIRRGPVEMLFERVLTSEKVLETFYGIDFLVNLTSWESIFHSLKANNIYVIAECEDMDEPTLLVLGKITTIANDFVEILGIDDEGHFYDSPTKIHYKELTLLKFKDRYIEMFQKYSS
jgi:hypothetical protein